MRASVNRPPTPDADDDRDQEPSLQEIINMKVDSLRHLRLWELLTYYWLVRIVLTPVVVCLWKGIKTRGSSGHRGGLLTCIWFDECLQLIESGEKERLKELLRERLIECGWRDELKAQCRAFTRKKGRGNITLDELVRTITPKGRAMVPDNVKAELLQRIRTFLMSDLS